MNKPSDKETLNTDIVPQVNSEAQTTSLGLTILPYAVEVFTDLERGKSFTTLHFRRRDTTRATALALVPEVIDDLSRAGLALTETIKVKITSNNAVSTPPNAKTKYDCYLEAPVQLLAEVQADEQRFVEAMRARYRTAG